MAKVNLIEDVLKHTDAEIIDYLAVEARIVRGAYKKAIENADPQRLYTVSSDLAIITSVLIALDNRNKQKGV